MKIQSFHADGTLSHESEALSRAKSGKGYVADAWDLFLSNGKRITSTESRLDAYYPGWRDVPEKGKS